MAHDIDSLPIQPVAITMIGTGDGGMPTSGQTMAKTPAGMPNLAITIVTPMFALFIRFVNVYGGMFIGLLSAAMTPAGGKLLYTGDFLQLMVTCASLAFPGAAVLSLKDIMTVFGRLEGKYPLLTGSV